MYQEAPITTRNIRRQQERMPILGGLAATDSVLFYLLK